MNTFSGKAIKYISFVITIGVLPFGYALAEPVFPNKASKLKSYELGEAILMLMPDKDSSVVGWDHRANESIYWKHDGYKSRRIGAYRSGILRVHVQGARAHVLKKQKHELAWSVLYETTHAPKFGVETATLTPGMNSLDDPKEQCFGELYDHCEFDPRPSLKSASITFTEVCTNDLPGVDYVVGYELTHPTRKKAFMVWSTSGGSGGTNSWITLNYSGDARSLCKQ